MSDLLKTANFLAEAHFDEAGVEAFCQAMREKLSQKRWVGRGGWHDSATCSLDSLEMLMIQHMEKVKKMSRLNAMGDEGIFRGYDMDDLVDVANLTMMVWRRLNELEPEKRREISP
ncbi:hypothetical protein LCGC14_0516930 [marine sediment metagenome]|uniref:Uncharacterized protein n=1 Tax=marine sediment metagenome TaxID=412755 RepID=A0A0F9S4E4_9ZZZZ